jgi:hypothetical protein
MKETSKAFPTVIKKVLKQNSMLKTMMEKVQMALSVNLMSVLASRMTPSQRIKVFD